jgi:hypothetical protein
MNLEENMIFRNNKTINQARNTDCPILPPLEKHGHVKVIRQCATYKCGIWRWRWFSRKKGRCGMVGF